MDQKIKKRSEIEERYKWNLADIFADDAAWEAAFAALRQKAEKFAAYDGHVAEAPEQAIADYWNLMQECMPVYNYAFLAKEADNGDSAAQAKADRVSSALVQVMTAVSFLEPELLSLDESRLKAMAGDPAMADYDSYIRGLLRTKAHTLPKEQERLIAMMGEVAGAPSSIFDMLSSVDMKFPEITMPDGSKTPLTEGTYSTFIHSDERDVRRQAFCGLMNTYAGFGSTIAAVYGASVKKDVFMAQSHRYASSRSAAMDPVDVPESVYDNLIASVHEALPVLNDYLSLRKQVMKLDELHLYDLYTNMVSDYHMDLPFEKAFDLVLQGLSPMGEDYLDKLREAHDNRWMDVYPSENKSSGAFSDGSLADVHPFVLLNHNDNLDSAFTIAHELGHSMHSYYSNLAQPPAKRDYSLFVAEVASICNEFVMMGNLLKTITDKKARAYLLNYQLEQFRTTCFRQTMFAEFEMISHEMAEKGEPLTRETLSDAYYKLNETYYGQSCVVDQEISAEWMRIPHFYNAFYVYVYATSLCAAVALSRKILTEGEPAVKAYRRFLSAGCSVSPIDALKLAGIDMSDPAPLRQAMSVFHDTLEQFRDAIAED